MNWRTVYYQSFNTAMQQWRLAAIVYFFELLLVLTLGMQVFDVLKASIGNSLEINKLLTSYDHTVLTDFLKVHGASITPLIGQLRWLLLTWLVFSVFINAGLLYCAARPEEAGPMTFWKSGVTYFFPFLKISLLFISLTLVWTIMMWLPMGMYLEPSLEYFPSEKYTICLVFCLLLVYLFGLALLFIWSVVSRLINIEKNTTIGASLKQGRKLFWQHKGRLMGLVFSFGIFQLVLILLYWWMEAHLGMTSPILILIMFLVQQAFVFFRLQMRSAIYAGIYLHTSDKAK